MTRIHFLASRRDQSIQEIVRFHAKALAARNLDPRSSLIFFAKCVSKFSSAARSECNHLVGKVRVAIGRFAVAKSTQSFNHRVLRLGLSSIDDVVNLSHIAKVGM